jgi:hypothetical protein
MGVSKHPITELTQTQSEPCCEIRDGFTLVDIDRDSLINTNDTKPSLPSVSNSPLKNGGVCGRIEDIRPRSI